MAILGVIMLLFMLLTLIGIVILGIIAKWKIFKKAGEKGWKALVPILDVVTLFKIAGISPLWILLYLTIIIPGFGAVACFGLSIYLNIKLTKAFGEEDAFAVGLILANIIFMMILAFGKAEYQLNKKAEEIDWEKV